MRKEAWGQTIQIAALTLYALFALTGFAKADPTPRPGVRMVRVVNPPPPPRHLPPTPQPDPRGGRPLPPPLPRPDPWGRCPPGTTLDPRIGRCVSVMNPPSRGPMRPVPPLNQDPDDISAANIVNQAMAGLNCEQAAESLRRVSNMVLSMAQSATPPVGGGSRTEPEFKRAARERIRSPKFWMRVWNRMADAYRSCDRGCFDDGVAVGQISATGYCSASVALNGLMGPGYLEQAPLPVCETAIRTGCIQSYQSTAVAYDGCKPYTQDTFDSIFREYISQDCHL